MKNIICLGIESTAHTFAISIIDNHGKIYSHSKKSYSTKSGGMIPHCLFQHHISCCVEVLKQSLQSSKLSLKNIDIIAYSRGPGLGNSLRVGAFIARFLSSRYDLPLIGVNHCISHLEIGNLLTKCQDPVLLYVSGANTQVIAFDSGKYRIFGETLDQGVGNLLDSFARHVGLGFPGGPKIDQLAKKGKLIDLPYSVKGMDVNFGGILTNLKQKYNSKKYKLKDLCYSLQETVFAMLVEISERAMAHCNKSELLLAGGVACNKRLQEMCTIMCKERAAKLFVPENQYLVDNAAMIAWTGILMSKSANHLPINQADIRPYERTDEIDVNWRN